MARTLHSNEFIIENFRSWRNKNYIRHNRINLLFGGNSSGKSSIIKAIGLLQQSLSSQRVGYNNFQSLSLGEGFVDRLKPSGANVDLGQIEHQKSRHIALDDMDGEFESFDSGQLGFGYRWNNLSEGPWKSIEFMSHFSSNDGTLQGLIFSTENQDFLQIKQLDDDKFKIKFSNDHDFWLPIFQKIEAEQKGLEKYFSRLWENKFELFRENPVFRQIFRALEREIEETRDRYYAFRKALSFTTAAERQAYFSENEDIAPLMFVHEKYDDRTIMETMVEIEEQFLRDYSLHITDFSMAKAFENGFSKLLPDFRDWKNFDTFMKTLSANCLIEVKLDTDSTTRGRFARNDRQNFVNPIDVLRMMQSGHSPLFRNNSIRKKILNMMLISSIFFPERQGLVKIAERMIGRFRAQLQRTLQIGPFRQPPARVSVIDPHLQTTQIGYSAENMLNILHHASDKLKLEVNKWLEILELGYQIETNFRKEFNIQELILRDENGLRLSILDVGFGVSQVLPIVIQSITSSSTLITIEQPELHIHPKLQANLAELFIWSVEKRGNQFLIETHSEHIILRLQRLQREKSLDEQENFKVNIFNDVTVSVIEKSRSNDRSSISELNINSKGEFNGEWPGGFFEERYIEKGII